MSEIDNYFKEVLAQMQKEQRKFHAAEKQRLDLKILAIEQNLENNSKKLAQFLLLFNELKEEQKTWEDSLRILQESYTELLEAFNLLYNTLKNK